MSMFQEQTEAWLSRAVPERAVNQCFDLPVVLATDIGLKRSENQDRVAALRIDAKASNGRPLIAIAVADGMGGMRDGAKCATLALSSFFYALIYYRSYEIEKRAEAAISYANDQVYRFAAAKGGATLSALLLDYELRPFIVHLGDSRVYAFGNGSKVERLTVDDSLAEAVGGHGRELLQFVGMGAGMQAHIHSVSPSVRNMALTTDGVHFINSNTFESVLANAPELKSSAERLAALARWCGGPDNASSAITDLPALVEAIREGGENGIQLWDAFGTLNAIWIKDEISRAGEAHSHVLDTGAPDASQIQPQPPAPPQPVPAVKARNPTKKRKTGKKKSPKEDIQLEIAIEQAPDTLDDS